MSALKHENPPYPDFLPVLKPEWKTDTVLLLARQVFDSGEWGTLPILADALQDAGCDNDDVLKHLREQEVSQFYCILPDPPPSPAAEGEEPQYTMYCIKATHEPGDRHKHQGGCWQGTCWVVNWLLGEPQRVLGTFEMPGMMSGDVFEAPVLNPGGGIKSGVVIGVWLVESASPYDSERVIVETPYTSTAQDEFVDSAFGEAVRLTEPDLSDYRVRHHDTTGNGEPHPDEWSCEWTADGKHAFDASDVNVVDLREEVTSDGAPIGPGLVYHGPGIRHSGVSPKDYAEGTHTCIICERPIGYLARSENQVCDSPVCRKTYDDEEYECIVCGKKYTTKNKTGYSDLVCSAECRNRM